jgi:hypothetical protein
VVPIKLYKQNPIDNLKGIFCKVGEFLLNFRGSPNGKRQSKKDSNFYSISTFDIPNTLKFLLRVLHLLFFSGFFPYTLFLCTNQKYSQHTPLLRPTRRFINFCKNFPHCKCFPHRKCGESTCRKMFPVICT